MMDVLCVGLACVDQFYESEQYPLENIKLERYEETPMSGGGPAANAACLLAKWGQRTAFAGRCGNDFYGQFIAHDFKLRGIRTDSRLTLTDYISAHSFILVNHENASRTILTVKDPRTSDTFLKEKATGLSPAATGLESFTYDLDWRPRLILADGHEPELADQAIRLWPDAISVLDAGSLRYGTDLLAPLVDYVVSSERFALQWTGLDKLETAADFQTCINKMKAGLAGKIVVTLGERGLIWEDNGQARHMPAFPARAVDSTGAGDIFHGAFSYALLKNHAPEPALHLASLAAALSVEKPGGRHSIPSLEDVEQARRFRFKTDDLD